MRDSIIHIAAAPHGEACAQVGQADYYDRSHIECKVFMRQLRRLFPVPETVAARFAIRSESHDFGSYREVAIMFDGSCEASVNYAHHVEANSPDKWDPIAQYELCWFIRRQAYERGVQRGDIELPELPELYQPSTPPSLDPNMSFTELMAAHPL